MVSEETDLGGLVQRLRDFTAARDWQRFHTPKNLAMALSAEVGELVAEFQWLTAEESAQAVTPGDLRERIESELADVTIYAALLADALDIDLVEAAHMKIDRNEGRFPPAE